MTQPRICPKSGMFIDEPEHSRNVYGVHPWGETFGGNYAGGGYEYQPEGLFQLGNCFATREDAQRYANYLKAMAKLRRSGGVIDTWIGDPYQRGGEYIMTEVNGCIYKLTPEEQNALLWPDEDKTLDK